MRKIEDLPIDLALFESVKRGNGALGNVRAQLARTWKRSICRVGGFWMGTSEWEGSRDEKLGMFLEGMMREVRESVGGLVTWQGFAAEMDLNVNGVHYWNSWLKMANKVKTIYTRIGDNEFTNGSAESGAWADYNTPTTNAQSTTWVTDGVYSEHIVSDSARDGAIIQAAIAITANKYYECRATVNIISGTWTVEIYQDDGTGIVLGAVSESNAGQAVLRCSIPAGNTYAGNVGVRVYCDGVGECYADGAVFQEGPLRAETAWYQDTASQTDYGVMETILLKAGMADQTANGDAQRYLAQHAYPKTQMPNDFAVAAAEAGAEVTLKITWLGYVWTTFNRYTTVVGTDDADDHVSALLGLCEFVSAGPIIEANTMQYQIDDRAPLRVWECFRDVAEAGDVDGDRWGFGVYEGRQAEYREWDTAVTFRLRGGQALHLAGGTLEPWFARPGLMAVDDMPIGPAGASGNVDDDPRVAVIDEVEFDCGAWLKGESGLVFRREDRGE